MKTTNRRASGYALLLGVGSLDTGHYGTTGVELISPEKDVLDYELIASLNGFVVQSFVGDNATRTRLLNAMAKIAKSLKSGDFLLLTFSGFGGIVTNFGSKERQHISATWCLYDGQLLLSEIRQALSAFQNGVNVLIISDCSSFERVAISACPRSAKHRPPTGNAGGNCRDCLLEEQGFL